MSDRKFRIVVKDYGEEDPIYIGRAIWTEGEAREILALMNIRNPSHTDDYVEEDDAD